jgi:hypothetical protein
VALTVSPYGAIYFALGSNAHSLVAGKPVNSVRARLKLASLLYDEVYLEGGSRRIQAGPTAAISMTQPDIEDPGWQSASERSRGQSASFYLQIAPEASPGVPAAGGYQQVVSSEATIAWEPTYEPFRNELTAGCDWVEFVVPPDPGPQWKSESRSRKSSEMDNPALQRLIPVHFVRSQVLDDSSSDLGSAVAGGASISLDPLHSRVIAARYARDSNLKPLGFAMPILMPRVGGLPWDEIVRVRKMKGMQQLRAVLREVELDAMETARSNGDLERQVHTRYLKKAQAATAAVDGMGATFAKGAAELVVGTAIGYATTGLALLGPIVGAVPGVAMTAWEVRSVMQQRKKRAWVGVSESLVG